MSKSILVFNSNWTALSCDRLLTAVIEGVLVAKKDYNLPKHNEIDTKNLYVPFLRTTSMG